VSAFLFQYSSDQQDVSIGTKIISGIFTSLLVFVPTTLHGYLFRRCKSRNPSKRYIADLTASNFEKLNLRNPGYVQPRNFLQTIFLDWKISWYWSLLLYAIAYASWVFCIFFTLIYGIKFREEEAIAFFESFWISFAISILLLQTSKAILGGIFTTVLSGIASLGALGGLVAVGEIVQMH